MTTKPSKPAAPPTQVSDQPIDATEETTPAERPAAAAAPVVPDQSADRSVVPTGAGGDLVDQLKGANLPPELLNVLASLHQRQRAVEQHVQAARGDQVAMRDQVIDLHRVVSQNADAIDQLAELIAPVAADPPEAAAAPVPQLAPRPPAPQRPPVAEHDGMGVGGIAGHRRDRDVRRFAPTTPIQATPAAAPARVLPPHNPRASAPPAPLPAVTTPVQPDTAVLDEFQIDPRQLGPGEHEITTPGGRQVLVRVHDRARTGVVRRQGAGRTFTAQRPPTGGGSTGNGG